VVLWDRALTPRLDVLPQLNDEALYARQRQQGELAAFDVLYARYERRLYGFIHGYLSARADVEEVFHDAFLQVLRSREVRFERGSFAAWIFKVARHLALNRVRGGRRASAAVQQQPPAEQPPGPDEQLAAVERTAALARAVAALPPGLAEVYRLRTGGMSYEDIAFTLEIPLGTVKSRTHEMVARLKTGVVTWQPRRTR
jgi:RNA polymerase sigma-70 factor (ECF subfamily)